MKTSPKSAALRKSSEATAVKKTEPGYINLRLPKIRFSQFTQSGFTPLLVTLLVIASYLLGMLTTKVQYLEKNGGANNNNAQVAGAQNPAGAQAPAAPQGPKVTNVDPGNLPMLGNADAKVTITEFSDFECPFCEQFYKNAMAQIKKDYVDTGKVKIAFRHYPLPFHPNAQKASEASECANDQSKFWEYHDTLFDNQAGWAGIAAADAEAKFVGFATELGLDATSFSDCLTSGKFTQKVQDDTAAGTAVGVSGTPTLYIGDTPIVGAQPYESFKAAIEEKLK